MGTSFTGNTLELQKPRIVFYAHYHCPDDCGETVLVIYPTKAEVPSRHHESGTDLVALVEVIETLLWVGSRKEESNSAEKNVPD